MQDSFPSSPRFDHCSLTRREKHNANGVGQGALEWRSVGVLKSNIPTLQYSITPFLLSVNAKQLEQPVFQAGPNRCKSDHGCHFVRVAQLDQSATVRRLYELLDYGTRPLAASVLAAG